jgi:hypothetical protein
MDESEFQEFALEIGQANFNLEEWKRELKEIKKRSDKDKSQALWDIGDHILKGQVLGRLGQQELKKHATEITKTSWENVQNYMWVSRSVPVSRRRENLSYSIHREVASFDEATQEMLLDRAEKGDPRTKGPLKVRAFQEAIKLLRKNGTIPPGKDTPSNGSGAEEPDEVMVVTVLFRLRPDAFDFMKRLAFARHGTHTPQRLLWEMALTYYKENIPKLTAELAEYDARKNQKVS